MRTGRFVLRAAAGTFPALALCVLAGCAGGWRNGEPPATIEGPVSMQSPVTAAASTTQGPMTFVWKGGGERVFLAGSFNDWKQDAEPMAKQADGSFTLGRVLAPGKYEYKFVVDGVWKEDPDAKEFVTDPYGGRNAVIVVGGGSTDAATTAGTSPAVSQSKGKPPVVGTDGVTFTYSGAAQSVALAGDFNGWATNADPMTRQSDGTWTLTKKLAPGTYNYKFLVDGKTWSHDAANPASTDDPFGGKNSVVTVK